MTISPTLRLVREGGDPGPEAAAERLDRVFFALSDPIRRQILERLDGAALLVSQIADPFHVSLQAVSKHIQVLVRAGLIQQERSGRISRCSLTVGPMLDAAVWMNRYSKYWQGQFNILAATLEEIDERRGRPRKPRRLTRPGRKGRKKNG